MIADLVATTIVEDQAAADRAVDLTLLGFSRGFSVGFGLILVWVQDGFQ